MLAILSLSGGDMTVYLVFRELDDGEDKYLRIYYTHAKAQEWIDKYGCKTGVYYIQEEELE